MIIESFNSSFSKTYHQLHTGRPKVKSKREKQIDKNKLNKKEKLKALYTTKQALIFGTFTKSLLKSNSNSNVYGILYIYIYVCIAINNLTQIKLKPAIYNLP